MSKSVRADKPFPGRDDCDPDELDEYVRAFEQTQNIEGTADLASFLPPADHPLHLAVLRELVRVDLEYGWERGCPKPLEHYQRVFPMLRSDREGLREIAFEEYRLRGQAGESPSPREYLDRFGVTVEPRSGRVFAVGSSRFASTPTPSGLSAAARTGRKLPDEISGLPEVGDYFLGFRLVGDLGRGSFGRVYLARQGDLANRPIVLKVTADRHDESQTLAQLHHDNIVPVYSSHSAGPLRAVCMPYLGSVTLRDVFEDLKSQGTLPGSGQGLVSSLTKSSVRKRAGAGAASIGSEPASEPASGAVLSSERTIAALRTTGAKSETQGLETLGMLGALSYVGAVVWMASKLADGLAHAHDRGILHRDMKPANILVTDDGKPMLLDFNLAEDLKRRAADPDAEETAIGGTLAYMAPEHLEAFRGGARPVDARSDLYSFGVILFEMLTGRTPFPTREGRRDEIQTAMIADRLGRPPSLRQWNPAVSPAVESVVRRCLEPDPSRRYTSARALAENLGRHLAHLPLKHAPDPSPAERAAKIVRRYPKVTVLVLALAASGALGLVASLATSAERAKIAGASAAADRVQERSRIAQSLLNGWIRDANHRKKGLDIAREALDEFHVLDDPSWWDRAPASVLLEPNHQSLRRDVGELLLMLARGETQEATATAEPGAHDRLLRSALILNERAEGCFKEGQVPRAVWLQRAEILLELGDSEASDDLAARAEATPLSTARDHILMGLHRFHQRRYAEALPYFEDAIGIDNTEFAGWFGSALCYEWLENPNLAERAYDLCVSLRREDAPSWSNRGLLALRRGDFERAKSDFERAERLVPDDPDPVANLAIVAYRQKRYEEAINRIDCALLMGATATRIYFVRAEAKGAVGDLAGAEADIQTGLSLKPTDALSWVTRGVKRDDPEGALADFDAALELEPNMFSALTNKAHVLSQKLGRTEDAIAVLDQFLFRNSQHAATLADRGILRARLGQDDAARADAEAAIKLEPRAIILYKVACISALTSRHSRRDRDDAIRDLKAALHKGYGADLLDTDPDLAPIREDREFQRLAEEAKRVTQSSSTKSSLTPDPAGR